MAGSAKLVRRPPAADRNQGENHSERVEKHNENNDGKTAVGQHKITPSSHWALKNLDCFWICSPLRHHSATRPFRCVF